MPRIKKLSLAILVTDWIKRDPLLKKHIHFDLSDMTPGDGLYLGSCNTPDGISYAVGYIAGTHPLYHTLTWCWRFVGRTGGSHVDEVVYHPGDPQFFEKLKIGLIDGHNSLWRKTGCQI